MNRSLLACLALVVLSTLPAAGQTPDFYDETVLRTVELTFSQTDWWQQLLANYVSETEIPADLTVDGVTYPDVGVRFKGNSTYNSIGNSQKKPFKITTDTFVPEQEVLGYDKITLNNAFKDPTFVREVLAYRVMRDYMPAPKANWIKLVINGESWGVYVSIEQVDKKFLDSWFPDDSGNRYKSEGFNSALGYLGSNPTSYQGPYELKSDPIANSWIDLVDVCSAVSNSFGNQVPINVPPVLNEDRSLWMNALNNVMSNLDSYTGSGHNYYIYHEPYHDRMQVIPWDLNEAFGVFFNGLNVQSIKTMSPNYQAGNPQRPMISRLHGYPPYRDRYYAHIRTILDEWFDWSTIGALVSQYHALIDAEVQADTKKLYSYALFLQNVTQDVSLGGIGPGPGGQVPGLQSFVDTRRTYLLAHPNINRAAPVIATVSHQPTSPDETDTVWINATVSGPQLPVSLVTLYHRVQGVFASVELFDDGLHNDGAAGDGVYGNSIAPQVAGATVEYYVRAMTSPSQGAGTTFFPRQAAHAPLTYSVQPGPIPPNTVKVNEFVAMNDAGIQDEAGEFEDWLELVNRTGGFVDLSGMYLTDELTDLTKWQIPFGHVLNPGDTLLIWCDDDPQDGPLHATFKLSASGEEILLVDVDGTTVLDHVEFGEQAADISTGRLFDGFDPQVTFAVPTPEALNVLVGCGTRSYSALDSTAHTLNLGISAPLTVGASSTVTVTGGSPSTAHFLAVANLPGYSGIPGTNMALLVDPGFNFLTLFSDSSGQVTLPVSMSNTPSIAGATLYAQVASVSGGALLVSNALELVICP